MLILCALKWSDGRGFWKKAAMVKIRFREISDFQKIQDQIDLKTNGTEAGGTKN